MSSYTANNKLIYTWTRGAKAIPVSLLTSYAESLILDGEKRVFWHHGRQYGNSYYMSEWGESFNDFQHNTATGSYSHSEGTYTVADGKAAHAAGEYTHSSGEASHAEGAYTTASAAYSHAEGNHTSSNGISSHAEGAWTNVTSNGHASHAEGAYTTASAAYSHAEGSNTEANGIGSHSEGDKTTASAAYSHAEGSNTEANGIGSHSEGEKTTASAAYSHAEGSNTEANGIGSHSEGEKTTASAEYSHAEGSNTEANGIGSHSEGDKTTAYGEYAHAEGNLTYAIGAYSHAEGLGTQAYNDAELAVGKWNQSITDGNKAQRTVFTIGDGTSYENRHNIVAVTQSYSYISNKSYFGDYVFAPLTNSYVDYTGPEKTLDNIIRALLDEGKYTRPVIYTKLAYTSHIDQPPYDLTDFIPSYIDDFNIVLQMEVGTSFRPCAYVWWPNVSDDREIGTRMSVARPDYNTVDPIELGYSYSCQGSTPIQFYFNKCTEDHGDWSYPKKTITEEVNLQVSYLNKYCISPGWTYLPVSNLENEYYGVMNEMSIAYTQSSYMLYKQLADRGMRQISYGLDSPWFEGGFATIPQSWYIDAKYRYFMGVTSHIPENGMEMRVLGHPTTSGFLSYNSEDNETECIHHLSHEDCLVNGFFWIAIPANKYQIIDYNSCNTIEVARNDGSYWDLVSELQPLRENTLYQVGIGEQVRWGAQAKIFEDYSIYYIDMRRNGCIGDGAADEIRVRVIGSDPAVGGSYIMTERRGKIAYDNQQEEATGFFVLESYEDQ